MRPVHSFVVTAKLPKKISKLRELAYNYWWCWNADARELFRRMDRNLWEETHHNPVMLINKLPVERLKELSEQNDFTSFLNFVHAKYIEYMKTTSWFDQLEKKPKGKIAYFSPEFGINESLPNYSGGLGVLSGDHLKAASDLGIPLVGIGLFYQQGYFRQKLTQTGWQTENYTVNDFYSMPCHLIKDDNDQPVLIDVDLPNGKVYAQVWQVKVGRVDLYLLDTNIDENENPEYRDITDQLYGGSRDTRIQQEILLGIGGMRMLEALNIMPTSIHINEGHAAFALLERTRMYMHRYGMNFFEAMEITKGSSSFTTHTPVPAGNEAFTIQRLEYYFHKYWEQLGLSREYFLSLGQFHDFNPNEPFSMTILGLHMTAYHNGVSKLHGKVSRDMWHQIWKCFPSDEVPIDSITNGIHTMTWVSREFSELYDRYLSPRWRTEVDDKKIWNKVETIPAEEIYREKQRRRVRLVLFIRKYLTRRQKEFLPPEQVSKMNEILDSHALTIGFARRFATYKRALLLFSDMERLERICKNPEKPMQIVLAGKAHPHDTAGKEVIQSIIQKVREHGLEKHIVFLEDYDMVIGRLMVKGCDVWLNNPIRPLEASGTSGMKAAINGTLNFSVLDGWWDEAFNGKNGFIIGHGEEYQSDEERDLVESQFLYDTLENVIVPMFYDRSSIGVPLNWVAYMKECIRTIAPKFSTTRMLREYANKFYIPALDKYKVLTHGHADNARHLKNWKDHIREKWGGVEIIDVNYENEKEIFIGKPIKVSAIVKLGELSPDDVIVQAYYGSVNNNGKLDNANYSNLKLVRSEGGFHHYEGQYTCDNTGMQGFTIRVLPHHENMAVPSELYLCA